MTTMRGKRMGGDGWVRAPLGTGRPIYGTRSYSYCQGIRIINGRQWHYRFDENPNSFAKHMFIKQVGQLEAVCLWWKRTLFGVCVGWHHHRDKDGMQRKTFGGRKPKWFFDRLLCGYFYGWRGLIIPDATRWTKRANRIYSQKKATISAEVQP